MKKMQIIALGEGLTTEFKRSGISNLGREVCAFANAADSHTAKKHWCLINFQFMQYVQVLVFYSQ